MSMFTRSTERTSTPRARWRSVIAVGIVAGLATIGMTALAPAWAEELPPAAVDATTPAGATVADESGAPPADDSAAPSGDDSAAPPDTGDSAAPEEQGEPAAPPAEESAAPPVEEMAAPPAEEASTGDIQVLLVPPGDEVVDKVEICHATASYKHPYEINEPAADGDVSGHADHTGPIFWPDIPKHTAWGDIIPPFFYDDGDETPGFFPGLNWTAEGEAIYANDCEIPTPEPDLFVFPVSCQFYGEPGGLEAEVGLLQENVDYRVIVSDSDGDPVIEWLISGQTGTLFNFWILPPGDYTITLEQSIIEDEWELLDEQAFTILPCPVLAVTATVLECSTGGGATGTGSTVVLFTGLIVGEGYSFSLDGPGDYFVFGEFIADATSSELTADLPPGDFVASIEWIPDPEVFATTTFTVVPCPPPAKPVKPVTPAGLAVTGTEQAPFLSAALLLFGLGGATLLAASRRRAGSSRTE